MKRIIENIWVGTVEDITLAEQQAFSVLGACKEPLHRKHARLKWASEDGYVTRAMSKDEPEYLFAERYHALYLNLIDARDMKYIPDKVINKALEFIDKELEQNRNVLIVCNKAESRSPSIIFMWMMTQRYFKDIEIYEEAKKFFTDNYCPFYRPSAGFAQYTKNFWEKYCNRK